MRISINECTREEITDKLKIAGFLIKCVGVRIVNTGTPADKEIVSLACDEISQMIDSAIYQLSEVTA